MIEYACAHACLCHRFDIVYISDRDRKHAPPSSMCHQLNPFFEHSRLHAVQAESTCRARANSRSNGWLTATKVTAVQCLRAPLMGLISAFSRAAMQRWQAAQIFDPFCGCPVLALQNSQHVFKTMSWTLCNGGAHPPALRGKLPRAVENHEKPWRHLVTSILNLLSQCLHKLSCIFYTFPDLPVHQVFRALQRSHDLRVVPGVSGTAMTNVLHWPIRRKSARPPKAK